MQIFLRNVCRMNFVNTKTKKTVLYFIEESHRRRVLRIIFIFNKIFSFNKNRDSSYCTTRGNAGMESPYSFGFLKLI